MKFRKMKLRSKTWPWAISIALHALVLAAIGLWAYEYYDHRDASTGRASGSAAAPASLEPTRDDAVAAMKHQERRVAGMEGQQRVDELKSRLDDLDTIPYRSVRGAAEFVEGIKGVKQDRWYQPNPEAKGVFQPNSATLYDITQRDKDGKTVYVYTIVDADGRSTTAELPATQVRQSDRWAFEVFEISRHNPKLRVLVDSALRIGENMTRDDDRKRREIR